MSLTIPRPRTLPLTICAMGLLLLAKGTSLSWAMFGHGGEASMPSILSLGASITGSIGEPAAARQGLLLAAGAEQAEDSLSVKSQPRTKPAPENTASDKATSGKAPSARGTPEKAKPDLPQPVDGAAAQPAKTDMEKKADVSDSERALLLDLRQRREELEARGAAAAAREAILNAAERRLASRVDQLQALQTRLEALETARREHDEANWRGLVKMYEGMKPAQAASIFNDLDMSVLLPIADRMKEAKAAAILAVMTPDKARQVTSGLAELRAKSNTPTNSGS